MACSGGSWCLGGYCRGLRWGIVESEGIDLDVKRFDEIVRARRAVRRFKEGVGLPEGAMEAMLDAARWAPSGYNLQPTHFVVVEDAGTKEALMKACMDQTQIVQAPATVVFVGDRDVARAHLKKVLAADLANGAVDERYCAFMRKQVKLSFGTGPCGFGWFWKAFGGPVGKLFRQVPSIPAVERRYWLAKQMMLSAMVFMLAATDRGLATCPMEGFDEGKVRKALGIPRRYVVGLVTPVGYAEGEIKGRSRLGLDELTHWGRWGGRKNQ